LQAWALFPSPLLYQYRVVGDGPEYSRLRELADRLGLRGVEFARALPPERVQSELAEADVFVAGARTAEDGDRDGIPNSILEAMAAGVPVVANDAGSISEVIRHRRTGWLVPGRAKALADALLDAALHPSLRHSIAKAAHHFVYARFSPDRNPSGLAVRLHHELAALGARRAFHDRHAGRL
jgi:glycosyltransferase involved in cell wall biosynthesis